MLVDLQHKVYFGVGKPLIVEYKIREVAIWNTQESPRGKAKDSSTLMFRLAFRFLVVKPEMQMSFPIPAMQCPHPEPVQNLSVSLAIRTSAIPGPKQPRKAASSVPLRVDWHIRKP